MNQQLLELLRNTQLQQFLRSAATRADAVRHIIAAADREGFTATSESIDRTLDELTGMNSDELREEELLEVSGGMRCNTSYTSPQVTKCSSVGCQGWGT